MVCGESLHFCSAAGLAAGLAAGHEARNGREIWSHRLGFGVISIPDLLADTVDPCPADPKAQGKRVMVADVTSVAPGAKDANDVLKGEM